MNEGIVHGVYAEAMTGSQGSIDLTNLPRFLDHLGHRERDPMASKFAKHLLDEGGEVVEFWGPEQMDVWSLTIRRGGHLLTFRVERGYPDPVGLRLAAARDHWPDGIVFRLAIFAWARAHEVALVPDNPLHFEPDLLAHGTAALDWLDAGNEVVVLRIAAAGREGFSRLGPVHYPEQHAEREAIAIQMMEDAAAAGTA